MRKTVPFLSKSKNNDNNILLLDKFEISGKNLINSHIITKVRDYLNISSKKNYFTSEEAIEIIIMQYDACLELMYSHKFWEKIRNGNKNCLVGYLLETSHYLRAASHRMASGVREAFECSNFMISMLAEHTIEEDGHHAFFENALKYFNCQRRILKITRPMPVTFEWIHLMRFVANINPVCAALCSGLLEYSVKDQNTIKKWHEMLVEKDILSQNATNSIYDHVRIDVELGHGSNWRNAILSQKTINSKDLSMYLNAICSVAEMFARWLNGLENLETLDLINMLSNVELKTNLSDINLDTTMSALPIFPSIIYNEISHQTEKMTSKISFAYAISSAVVDNINLSTNNDTMSKISDFIIKSTNHINVNNLEDLIKLVEKSWMNSLNGHQLWKHLLQTQNTSLTYGWILENYYYISCITQHNSCAISSCTDPLIRSMLVKHLKEEFDHGVILKKPLIESEYGIDFKSLRPLPTTLAFVGALTNLAKRDWKGYVIAMYYLQMTIYDKNNTFETFYNQVSKNNIDSNNLIKSLKKHDMIDGGLDHHKELTLLISSLFNRNQITKDNISNASIVIQLQWSFLDGILEHYKSDHISIISRMGWN